MKRLLLVNFSLFFLFSVYGQWKDGGTLLSNADESHHRVLVSENLSKGVYISWMSIDINSINRVYLTGVDEDGNLLPGWLPEGNLVSQAGDFFNPEIITSEDGGIIISWDGIPTGSTQRNIFIQKYSPNGTKLWNGGNPIQVSNSGTNIDKIPVLCTDKQNGAYISWTRYDSLISATSPDIFLQHFDKTGNISTGWNVSGTEIAVLKDIREAFPRIVCSNDESAVYVMYTEGLAGGSMLKLKKINPADGTVSDAYPTKGLEIGYGPWVYSSSSNDQFLFCDKQNNIVLFWREDQLGSLNGQLFMQIVKPDGKQMLRYGGKYIGGKGALIGDSLGTTEGTSYIEVSQDEDDNYLAVFPDYTVSEDLCAVKVGSDGNIIWQNLNITTDHNSAYPKAVSDGHKGMYIFYKNFSYMPSHLYAIALDSLGHFYNNNWTVPGTDFGTIDNFSFTAPNLDFDVVSSGKDRAIVAWDRKEGNMDNIFVCNLLYSGKNCSIESGINEFSATNYKLQIYPNPFINEFYIKYSLQKSSKDFKLFIYDIAGRVLLTKEINLNFDTRIEAGFLSKSMYFYKIESDKGLINRGIIVKN